MLSALLDGEREDVGGKKYLYVGLFYLNNSEFWSVCYGSLCLMIYWDMNKYKSSQIFLMWFNRNDLCTGNTM